MKHLTILSQFQEISSRTGIPVAQLMEARERAADLLLEVVGDSQSPEILVHFGAQ